MVPKPPYNTVEPTPSADSVASNVNNEVIIPYVEVSDVNLQEESAPQAEGKSSLADGADNSTKVKESIKRAEGSNKTSYLGDNVVTDFPDENDSKSSRSSTPSMDKNSSEKTNESLFSQITKMTITDDNVSSLSETDLLSTTESSNSEKPDKSSEKSDVNRPVTKLISTASSSNTSSFDDSDKIMSDKLESLIDDMHLESEGSMEKEADKITYEHVPSIKLSTSCSSFILVTAKTKKLPGSPRKIRDVKSVSESRAHSDPKSRSSSGSSYKTAGENSDEEISYEIPNLIHESSQSNEELPKKMLYSGDLVAVSLPYFPTQSDVVKPPILPVGNAALPQPGVLRSFKPRMDLSHGLSSGSLQEQSSISADSIDTLPSPPQSPRVRDLEELPEDEGVSQETEC